MGTNKNQARKLLLSFFTMLMPLLASAHDFEADGIYYKITSSTEFTVAVTYQGGSSTNYSNEYQGMVNIPETIRYEGNIYNVTSIGESAFSGCTELTSVSIPQSVLQVSNASFDGCSGLKEVIIEDGSESLYLGCNEPYYYGGEGLFYFAPLKRVYLGRNIGFMTDKSAGYSPFYNKGITLVTIGDKVTAIKENTFQGCESLNLVINYSELTLHKGSTEYGKVAYSAERIINGKELINHDDYLFYTDEDAHCLVNYIGSSLIMKLPNSYQGESYQILDWAFNNLKHITSVIIPNTVTSVGDHAFYGCTGLKEIVLEEGDETLVLGHNGNNQGLFYDCPLDCVYLGRNLDYNNSRSYGYSPFYKQDRSPVLTLGESITSINSYLFYNNNLTSITIPKNIVSIENYAFDNCTSLKDVIIEDDNEELKLGYNGSEQGLFYDSPLEKIYLGRNLDYSSGSSYGYSPFYKKDRTPLIIIGANLTSINSYLFFNNKTITSLTIPENIISIKNHAFDNCTSLKEIIFEDGGETLSLGYNYYSSSDGQGLFFDCPLENVYLGRNLSYDSHRSYGYSPFYDKDLLTSVTLGNKVTMIESYSFYGCDNIPSLTINNCVLSIGDNAFSYPKKVVWLTNTPPAGYQYGKGMINYVSNEQYTDLGNANIYPYLSSMFEVDGVKYVPVSPAERTCAAIDCVYDNAASTIKIEETVSFKGVAMTIKEIMPYTFYENKNIKDVLLSHNGAIGDYAFYNCTSLSKATLGDNVTALGKETFSQCISLQEMIIPDSVRSIGESCFFGCSTLKDITIGTGITSIERSTFSDCSSLSGIAIPKGITIIKDYAFSKCSNLSNFIIEDRNTSLNLGSNGSSAFFADCPLDSVYIGGKITYYTSDYKGYSPFYRNTSLRAVVITDEEKQIYDNEFYGCTSLKNVSVGNGVTTIGKYAFSGCNSLEGLTFGSSVKEIGEEAFSDCNNVKLIISGAVNPPVCGLQALDDINKWDCQLNIPIGYKERYTGAEQWKEFFFIEDKVVVPYYSLKFVVDSTVWRVDSLPCGEFVVMPDEPIKEGHTFCGWSEVPETMPASDVTISGSFAINSYILEYIVDGNVYKTDTITYGDSIAVIPPLVKDGYTFSGWSEAPAVMPADSVIVTGSFAINSYLLNYTVDGDIVQSDSIVYGTEVIVIDEPIKEGYTFSGWSEVPEAMPANDVTISGTFSINKYLVTFKIDDEVIAADSLEYGAVIIAPEAPEKEGHTFNGWNGITEKVPANDVTIEGSYSVNFYLLAYMVDGEIVKADSVAYGTTITLLDEPIKEGYTFSGWGEVPNTMPANEVTISGTFTINKYLVTFKIDDEIIAADSLEYGVVIVAPEAPEKEGYTFNGWDEVIETVPANDVTIEGSYSVNSYLLTYAVDGEIVKADSIAYGTVITLLDEPTKEGHTFSGWSEAPETMPASDVAISGTFTINQYTITYIIDGEVFATDTINYGEAITVPDVPVKEGYDFAWSDEIPGTMPAKDIVINGSYTTGILNALIEEDVLYIYTTDGQQVNVLQKGINIVLLKDGRIRKLFHK